MKCYLQKINKLSFEKEDLTVTKMYFKMTIKNNVTIVDTANILTGIQLSVHNT